MANSVYDPDKPGERAYHPHNPDPLDNQAAGDSTDPRASASREDLRKAEPGGSTGSNGSFNFNPSDKTGSSGGDFNFNANGDKKGGVASAGLKAAELSVGGGAVGTASTFAAGAKNFFWGSKNRKRATVGGGVTGTIVGGSIFIFIIISGPGQLIQLSQMLQKNFTNMDNASSSRATKLLGSAGAQDIGETRVGVIQRQYLRNTLTKLNDIGVQFESNGTGGLNKISVDTGKLLDSHPELRTMTTNERQAWLADRLGVSPDKLVLERGGIFSIDTTEFKISAVRSLLKNSADFLPNGNILSAENKRVLTKYFDAPSIFHPIEKSKAAATKKLTNVADRRAAAQEEEARTRAAVEAPGEAAVSDVKGKASKYTGAASNALLFTGGVCLVKSISGEIVTINRSLIVLPSAVQATSFIAVGDQIKSGQDVSAEQVGALQESLTNSQGQNVWQGKALQVTEGAKHPSGQDIPPDYQSAFSPDTTANTINDWANHFLGGELLAGAACSPPGLIAQAGLSIILGAASIITEIGTAGTATPAVVGGWAAKESLSFAVSAVALHFIQQFVLNSSTSGKLAKDAFSGPLGGNLLAYGAREAANIGARSEGGIALAGSASAALAAQNQKADEQQFRSESFADRTFNINDGRTLVGKLAQSVSPSYSTNMATAVHGFGNLGGNLLASLASIFIPKSQAASNDSYNWGFPEYSIPPQVLNDPNLSSPPANADKVAILLDGGGQSYIDRSLVCFGNKISKDSGVWDIDHVDDPNPNDQDYIDARCDNISDYSWRRMIMFNVDTFTADGMACWAGDDQSCTKIGFGSSGGSPTAGSTPTDTASTTIDMDHLYDSSVDIACAPGTKDLGIQDGYHDGTKVKIRVCAVDSVPETGALSDVPGANGKLVVNSRLSAFYVNLVKDAQAAGVTNITAQEGFRSMARQTCLYEGRCGPTGVVAAPGTSNHQMGLAVDWSDSMINYLNQNPHGLKALVSGEPWHWSPTGN